MTLLDPAIVDPQALYIADTYSGQVNATSFGQGLTSYRDVHGQWWQYAAWYGANGNIRVGRKGLLGWETVELPHTITNADSHNIISIGVSPVDGRLHLAGDCHASPVAYTRSIANLCDDPELYPWDVTLFDAFSSTLVGTVVGDMTYPVFFPTPEGLLQLAYRIGTSTSGRMALAEYDGTWTLLGSVTDNLGSWLAPNGQTSNSRNFYYSWPAYTGTRLHVAGTWREGDPDVRCAPTAPIPNHHTAYFYSDDRGRTWHNNSGVQVGTTGTTLIGVSTAGILVDSGTGIQFSLQVDSATAGVSRPALVQSYVRGGLAGGCVETEAERVDKATNTIRYQKADGTWTYSGVTLGGADYFLEYPSGRAGRSQLVVDSAHNFYVIMPGGRILSASAPTYTDWAVVFNGITEGWNAFGECLIDRSRVLSDGVVSVGYQRQSSGTTPSAFCVRDFQLGG